MQNLGDDDSQRDWLWQEAKPRVPQPLMWRWPPAQSYGGKPTGRSLVPHHSCGQAPCTTGASQLSDSSRGVGSGSSGRRQVDGTCGYRGAGARPEVLLQSHMISLSNPGNRPVYSNSRTAHLVPGSRDLDCYHFTDYYSAGALQRRIFKNQTSLSEGPDYIF